LLRVVAVMVALPTATPVTLPALPTAVDTVAIVVSEEVQTAWMVRSCVVVSENVPVAVSNVLAFLATLAGVVAAVTTRVVRVAGVTVKVAVALKLTVFRVMTPVMTLGPAAIPVTCPR
jgi:hypothetical protein